MKFTLLCAIGPITLSTAIRSARKAPRNFQNGSICAKYRVHAEFKSLERRDGSRFMKDPYETLGIARSATDKDIKDAFKKLARKFHPDLHPGDKTAEEKF